MCAEFQIRMDKKIFHSKCKPGLELMGQYVTGI